MTLVVVDLQEVFATGPWGAPRFAEIVPAVERLVAEHDGDVVFTRFVAPADPQGAWRDYYAAWPFALRPAEDPMWRLVAPFADCPSLDASTFGKWDERLAATCGDELVVSGVATDCCVVSTVLAAADAGRRVRVVRDACAGADDDAHDRALQLMASYAPLVEVV